MSSDTQVFEYDDVPNEYLEGNTTTSNSERFFSESITLFKILFYAFVALGVWNFLIRPILFKSDSKKTKKENNESSSSRSIKGTHKLKKSHTFFFTNTDIHIAHHNIFFFLYATLPLNAFSRFWGIICRITWPYFIRPYACKAFCWVYNINMSEIKDQNWYHYDCFTSFFYRNIRKELRPIAQGDHIMASPCDGTVLQMGRIDSEKGQLEQVKGMTYSIQAFLGTHSEESVQKSTSNVNLSKQFNEHRRFMKKMATIEFEAASQNDNNSNKVNDEVSEVLSPTSVTNSIIDGKHKEGSPNHNCECPDSKISEMHIHVEDEGDKFIPSNEIESKSKTSKLINELASITPNSLGYNNVENTKDTDLYFAVIYLSPANYHHFHAPVNWVCKMRRHFPGRLFSVNPYFQRTLPNLFILNERVPLLGYWKYGFFSMTMVGATNVGSVKLNFDKDLHTNTRIKKHSHHLPYKCYEATYENASNVLQGVPIEKGEEMGGFEFGSTVVICFQAPKGFKFNIRKGAKVQVGQQIGEVYESL